MRLRSILILVAVLALDLAASCASSAADRDEIVNLLTDLNEVRNELRVDSGTSEEGDRNAIQQARIQARMKLSGLISKLRDLIKVGTNILDYPGLISAGNVTYSSFPRILGMPPEDSGAYRLYLGIPPKRGIQPRAMRDTDFEVVFDDRGLITAVEDVVWKH